MTKLDSTVYFLSEYGMPISRCTNELTKITELVHETYPYATQMYIEIIGDVYGETISVTFYEPEQGIDMTLDVEQLDIKI